MITSRKSKKRLAARRVIRPWRDFPVIGIEFRKGSQGFTLLELMLSVVIISLIILIIVGALRLGFRSVEAGEKKVESLERVRNAITLLESQIQSELPLAYYENAEKKYYFRGKRTSLDLATNYSVWGGEKGYVVAHYEVAQEPGGRQTLWVKENIIGQESSRETRMLEQVAEFYFEYFVRDTSKAPQDDAGRWVEEWVDDDAVPTTEKLEKIKFHVRLENRVLNWIIPLKGRGAQSAAAASLGGPMMPAGQPAPVTPVKSPKK
jgi:prepilin-type N-terminal cleavage/methylation domain-containing protein